MIPAGKGMRMAIEHNMASESEKDGLRRLGEGIAAIGRLPEKAREIGLLDSL